MNLTIVLPLAVSIIGCVVYVVAPGKASDIGRIAYGVGLLAFLLQFAGKLQLTAG